MGVSKGVAAGTNCYLLKTPLSTGQIAMRKDTKISGKAIWLYARIYADYGR